MVIIFLIVKGSLDLFHHFFLDTFADISYLLIGNGYCLACSHRTFCRCTLGTPHPVSQ